MDHFDVVIVGAGIVGLATAHRLQARFPGRSILMLERGEGVAREQSGRNSGVVHSGIYYKPGSLRATLCRRGKAMLEEFCAEHAVPLRPCGKLIVATHPREEPSLDRLVQRGAANGVRATKMAGEQIAEIEPHARGVAALHVEESGVVNFGKVSEALARAVSGAGGKIALRAGAMRAREESDHVVVETGKGEVGATHLIACAGMDSDRFARASGLSPGVRIVPFRGSYCVLREEASHLCRSLIYPVPDRRFTFLGVHFTRGIDDTVEVGPTAAPALRRGGLRPLTHPGLWVLGLRHPLIALREIWRTNSKSAFFDAPRMLVPELTPDDLLPAPPGFRAQAIRPNGTLVDDFAIAESARMIHVCNAPSPAATASLAIGDHIVDLLERRLGR